MINTEHLPAALYSFRRSHAWIFGFKAENSETLLKAADGSRVEVLGGSFLCFNERQGPVIDSRDSAVTAVFLLWHWALAHATIWRNRRGDRTVELPPPSFIPLAQVDAAVLHLQSGDSDKKGTV